MNPLNLYSTPPIKILIVEDEAGARALLCSTLKSEGYEVMAVEDGEACLNLYPHFQPDLVLLDAILPGMDGFDCCRALRAQTTTPQAQIVMLSGLVSEDAVNEALDAGVSDYIAKPIHPAVLRQQIRRLIQQADTQRQLEVSRHKLQQQLQQLNILLEQVLEKLQETIAQSNEFKQLKTNFIKHLSHNIRNPLNVILASSELLELPLISTDDTQANYLQKIGQGVDEITHVLTLLITFEQLTSGEYQFHPVPTDLIQLCQGVVDQCQHTFTVSHSLVFTHQGLAEPSINVDVTLIQQALHELISNALRYSPTGGKIRVQLQRLSNSLVLMVEDEGIGIPDAERLQVFNPFYRASNANDVPGTPGLGIGLAIVQQVVALHQGTVSLQSKLNSGTTVLICLPRWSTASQDATVSPVLN